MTAFYLDTPDQKQEIFNRSIVPVLRAIDAAQEFLVSKDLPRAIEWFEL